MSLFISPTIAAHPTFYPPCARASTRSCNCRKRNFNRSKKLLLFFPRPRLYPETDRGFASKGVISLRERWKKFPRVENLPMCSLMPPRSEILLQKLATNLANSPKTVAFLYNKWHWWLFIMLSLSLSLLKNFVQKKINCFNEMPHWMTNS